MAEREKVERRRIGGGGEMRGKSGEKEDWGRGGGDERKKWREVRREGRRNESGGEVGRGGKVGRGGEE